MAISEAIHIATVLYDFGSDVVVVHALGAGVDASEGPAATIHMLNRCRRHNIHAGSMVFCVTVCLVSPDVLPQLQ